MSAGSLQLRYSLSSGGTTNSRWWVHWGAMIPGLWTVSQGLKRKERLKRAKMSQTVQVSCHSANKGKTWVSHSRLSILILTESNLKWDKWKAAVCVFLLKFKLRTHWCSHVTLIPVLTEAEAGRCLEFKASLIYVENSRTARATQRPCLEKQNKIQV